MTFNKKKNTRSKRHSNYYDFEKNRVYTRSLTGIRTTRFLVACHAKMVSKICLLENSENRKWHQLFIKVRHWHTKKTVPASVFFYITNQWTIIGNQCFLMVQNHWTILKNKHFSWFLVIRENNEKTMPNGTSKVMYFGSKMGTWASQVQLIFWFLTFWCDALPVVQQIR